MRESQEQSAMEPPVLSREVPLWMALVPVVALVAVLVTNVRLFGDNATYGANQMALLFSAAIAIGLGRQLGIPFSAGIGYMTASIASSLKAILILLIIGGLIGTWMMAGIVPAMIHYGLQILSPSGFLVLTVLICSVVSLATGSSWTTAGTVGIALIGIGGSMGFSIPMVAGAVISGAYFGDKISPLSDTTNLAPAMAGTDLYTHIRYMLWTTVPTYTLTLVFFGVLNYYSLPTSQSIVATELSSIIDREFNLSPWLLAVPVLVLVMVAFRVDAVVALFVAMLLGALVAVCFQPSLIVRLAGGANTSPVTVTSAASAAETATSAAAVGAGVPEKAEPYLISAFRGSMKAMALRTQIITGNSQANELLKGKGMEGMLNTVWLIVCAMCFGGAMEAAGFLQRLTQPLVRLARGTASLIATTAASCVFTNLTASDQYISIVMPGRMFRNSYQERGLAPQNLSRTLEDSGTVTSVLVPWNTCGAYMSGALACETLQYLPYAAFCWISPLMTVLVAFLGIGIARLPSGPVERQAV